MNGPLRMSQWPLVFNVSIWAHARVLEIRGSKPIFVPKVPSMPRKFSAGMFDIEERVENSKKKSLASEFLRQEDEEVEQEKSGLGEQATCFQFGKPLINTFFPGDQLFFSFL